MRRRERSPASSPVRSVKDKKGWLEIKGRKEDRKQTWQSEWTNYTAYRVLAGLNEYCRRYPEAPHAAPSSSSSSLSSSSFLFFHRTSFYPLHDGDRGSIRRRVNLTRTLISSSPRFRIRADPFNISRILSSNLKFSGQPSRKGNVFFSSLPCVRFEDSVFIRDRLDEDSYPRVGYKCTNK